MIKARVNHQIKAAQLRVIAENGENLGILPLSQALIEAKNRELDLIEVSPNIVPPIAKIMDYGKYQYDEKKKSKVAKTRSQTSEMKTVQVKIGTSDHDLELKAKRVSEWLSEGNRVKIDLYLIGRAKYMDIKFLKGRLDRILKLINIDYKVPQEPVRGPKGLALVVERK